MEEVSENSKELLHSAHANGMNEVIWYSNTHNTQSYTSSSFKFLSLFTLDKQACLQILVALGNSDNTETRLKAPSL